VAKLHADDITPRRVTATNVSQSANQCASNAAAETATMVLTERLAPVERLVHRVLLARAEHLARLVLQVAHREPRVLRAQVEPRAQVVLLVQRAQVVLLVQVEPRVLLAQAVPRVLLAQAVPRVLLAQAVPRVLLAPLHNLVLQSSWKKFSKWLLHLDFLFSSLGKSSTLFQLLQRRISLEQCSLSVQLDCT